MRIFELICNFFRHCFTQELEVDYANGETKGLPLADDDLNSLTDDESKIDVSKRTLTTRLYVLEQEIEIFRYNFPNEFASYKEEIKRIKNDYDLCIKEISKDMTFEIDPEIDSRKIMEIDLLEKRINKFINSEVKFYILSQKLQKLAVKLNILYNVTISHYLDEDKENAMSQLEHAKSSVNMIVQDFKECDYILNDKRLKERLVNLISFVDYEILRISLRNSKQSIEIQIDSLASTTEFAEFNHIEAFKAFIQDEVGDLSELLLMIKEKQYRMDFEKRISKLFETIVYSEDFKKVFYDTNFWDEIITLESNVIEILKLDGIDKEKARVKLIDRMDIQIDKSEVLTSPKTNAYLALTSIFSKTHETKTLLLIKLFKNLSEEITYKEIYFLLLLFDSLQDVKNTSNGLLNHIEKYVKKYPYDNTTIQKKKDVLIQKQSQKEYLYVFSEDEKNADITYTLGSLNIDYTMVDNNCFINSFYFNGMDNVLNSLKANTINTTT